MKITHVAHSNCLLGEGPVWMAERGELVFVDIIGRKLMAWSPQGGLRKADTKLMVGSFARLKDGRLLAAAGRGLYLLDPLTGALTSLGRDELIGPDNLMNDGKCDRSGAFVFGSKDVNEKEPSGCLMHFSGAQVRQWNPGIVLNGPAFSPDGARIYFADSPTRRIFTATWDTETGTAGSLEVFATLSDGAGFPDGMTIDSAGGLWNAHWDGWRISRYHPNGCLDMEIDMPVARPTSVAFGGPDMKTLFITSARIGRADEPVPEGELDGDLFSVETGFTGLPEPAFAGAL